jgi:hypothetical protein
LRTRNKCGGARGLKRKDWSGRITADYRERIRAKGIRASGGWADVESEGEERITECRREGAGWCEARDWAAVRQGGRVDESVSHAERTEKQGRQ